MKKIIFILMFTASATLSLAQFVPPDFNGEPANHSHAYWQNMGQLLNTDDMLATEVKYYTLNANPAVYLADEFLSIVFAKPDTIQSTADSLYRIDMTLNTEFSSMQLANQLEQWDDYQNFFFPHIPNGVTNVKGYKRIWYQDVYPGIDFHVYSNAKGLKYYFVIRPGGNPANIHMNFSGVLQTLVKQGGELALFASFDSLQFEQAHAYQVDMNLQVLPLNWQPVYSATGNTVAFSSLGAYNPALPLVLQMDDDPAIPGTANGNLDWSTYEGGPSAEIGMAITTNQANDVFVTGFNRSAGFPTDVGPAFGGVEDAFVEMFDYGAARLWATYYGGNNIDRGMDIAYNPANNLVYITGKTKSANLPIRPVTNPNDGTYYQDAGAVGGGSNYGAFVAAFDPYNNPGALIRATYFGGDDGDDAGRGMAIDASGNVFIAGNTAALAGNSTVCNAPPNSGFPLCDPGGGEYYQDFNGGGTDGFIAKFDANFNLLWSTFYGSSADEQINDITVDDLFDNVFVTGTTGPGAFVNTNNCGVPTGGSFPLCWQTGTEYFQDGSTGSENSFISKFDNTGVILWSTILENVTEMEAVATWTYTMAFTYYVYVVGYTSGNGTPTCQPPGSGVPICNANNMSHQQQNSAGFEDMYIMKFNESGELIWSTFYGGPAREYTDIPSVNWSVDRMMDVATDDLGLLYIAGVTQKYVFGTFPAYYNVQFYNQAQIQGIDNSTDITLTVFGPANALMWSSLFGGGDNSINLIDYNSDFAMGIATFQDQYFYVTGYTNPDNFPTECPPQVTTLPYCKGQFAYPDVFISRFDMSAITTTETLTMEDGAIHLWPNPTTGKFEVSGSGFQVEEIEVFDLLGREVYSRKSQIANGAVELDISSCPAGIYFVRIGESTEKVVLTK